MYHISNLLLKKNGYLPRTVNWILWVWEEHFICVQLEVLRLMWEKLYIHLFVLGAVTYHSFTIRKNFHLFQILHVSFHYPKSIRTWTYYSYSKFDMGLQSNKNKHRKFIPNCEFHLIGKLPKAILWPECKKFSFLLGYSWTTRNS